MAIKVAINGFGRIGRNTFRAALGKNLKQLNFVAINDLTSPENLAYLLQYDTAYGNSDLKIGFTKDSLIVNGKKIKIYAQKDPSVLPWKKLGINVVLECTGFFTNKEGAELHLKAGAKKVIVSAPAKELPTVVFGANAHKSEKVEAINMGSCTTNCVAPITAIIDSSLGIKKAWMTTIHSYTSTQKLQDGPSQKDVRRGRAAAQNIVPTTTGAAKATVETLPQLKNKFDAMSVRVPTITGSLSDFTFLVKKKTTTQKVINILKKAKKNSIWKNVIELSEGGLVSSDIIGNPYSAIIDLPFTNVIKGDMVKILAWYDNEWGYSSRLAEMAVEVGKN
ncbi:type I glyceraldehyde-3-phosphate dehydrogenase [Candidatus Falkowbacteria bacterium]|nr:type I glyceraldehyde-3-phosphate dehydrogenase [Candidatus Falkowbacteria bacterium]